MRHLRWFNNPNFANFQHENWNNFFKDDFATNPTASQPKVNIHEDEKGYSLELAAPGFAKEDFKIDLEKDVLTISVEKKTEQTEDKKGYTRREFHYGSFKRSFILPEVVDADAIKGAYENGILTVALPKKAEVVIPKKEIAVA